MYSYSTYLPLFRISCTEYRHLLSIMSSFIVLRKTSKKNTLPGKDKEETAEPTHFSASQKKTLESYAGIWRVDLLDDSVTPFTLDGQQWNTVTHYVCAQRFKTKAPDVYHQFTAGSASEICDDARKAEKQKSPAGMRLAKLKESDVDEYRTRAIRAKLNDTPGLRNVVEVLKDTNTRLYVMGRTPGASKKLVPVEDRVYTTIMTMTGGASSSSSSSGSSGSGSSSSSSGSSSSSSSSSAKTVKTKAPGLTVASKEDEELYQKDARLMEDEDGASVVSSATESDSDEDDSSDEDSSEDTDGDDDSDSDDDTPDDEKIGARLAEDDDDDDLVEHNAEQRNQRLLQQFHPEKMHLTENALRVVKKESFHKKTPPFLTRFEQTRILSFRTRQLLEGARPYIPVTPKMDSFDIAKEELKQRKIPYIIKRPLPDGTFDYHQLKSMSLSQRMTV